MDTTEIDKYRRKLQEARERLIGTETARSGAADTVELDQTRTGRLSRMDALQTQAMAKARQERAGMSLRRIEAALRRCDTGDYGYCVECDEPIDPRRLEAEPAVSLCLACAERREG